MLKELYDAVFSRAETTATTKRAQVFKSPGDDARNYTVEHNGQLIPMKSPAPLRGHLVESLGDLIAAAKKWAEKGTVWISRDQVVVITDDEDRRERITLRLMQSAVYMAAVRQENHGLLAQVDLIRLLRREFSKSPEQPALLSAVRKIKFSQSSSGHSTIEHGNESMGKTIEAEITGASEIAETLVVPVRVYLNAELGEPFQMGFDLEVDVQAQRFILKPMPDETTAATDDALRKIHDELSGELSIPVFFGTP